MDSNVMWQELLDACQQKYVSPFFNEENFPSEPVASDEAEWEAYEHHFSEVVAGETVFRRLEELGYKLCGPCRAMEFIASNPTIQLDHPLVVTTQKQGKNGIWYVPIFSWVTEFQTIDPILILGNLDHKFYPQCGWLVLRKRT